MKFLRYNVGMKNLVLASASPRRKALLERAGVKFTIKKSNFEESNGSASADETARANAFGKASGVVCAEDEVILGADTVVALDGEIFGKPATRDEAFSMLKKLSGRVHSVITGVALVSREKSVVNSCLTRVSFANLTDEQIFSYIDEFKPFDKAGAYGIQELPTFFETEIEGSFDNVVGLPVELVLQMLNDF